MVQEYPDILGDVVKASRIKAELTIEAVAERAIRDSEVEEIVHMLYTCDERSLRIVKATLRAALESQRVDTENKKTEPTNTE